MKTHILLKTGAIFITEDKVQYQANGDTVACNGYLAINGNIDYVRKVESFTATSNSIMATWTTQ